MVGLSTVVNAHTRLSFSNGKWSIVNSSCSGENDQLIYRDFHNEKRNLTMILLTVLAVVLCNWCGTTLVIVVHFPVLYVTQNNGSFELSSQLDRRLHLFSSEHQPQYGSFAPKHSAQFEKTVQSYTLTFVTRFFVIT